MCYHTHYIFLACGHSVSTLHPIRPSPPCPNQDQPPAKEITAASAAPPQRPFSFDPSVIASPLSPLAEPFPVHAPWRLEGPFSTPESTSSIADDNEDDLDKNRILVTYPNIDSKITVTGPITVGRPEDRHEGRYHNTRTGKAQAAARPHTHCGEILTHPYRSYKIEGLCLHCRRRRDTLLASFEVNSIREAVNRESPLGSNNGRQQRRFEGLPPPMAGQNHAGLEGNDRLKSRPIPMPVPVRMLVPGQGRNVHFEPRIEGAEHQQQTPWRLALPPAEIPKTGAGLAGMRDGEWI
ncbi:hypothetical protein GJ744_008524 [Endocarpon pusillum]|uniref:Uncharacterized protein n=1 Tax=Endocarpon pusillum TaxID=364733 RepID=A0A8H7AH11_9EURO|nr:hypothetical protein GJ744_008524 [Endocarpon pusillum]